MHYNILCHFSKLAIKEKWERTRAFFLFVWHVSSWVHRHSGHPQHAAAGSSKDEMAAHEEPLLCLQTHHLLFSLYLTSFFIGKHRGKPVSGSPSACYHHFSCHQLKTLPFFFFFFGRIFSSPSHASLSTYGAFQWSSSLIKSTCLWKLLWIWMLSHLMGMQSWNPLHFLYNLLIEWYLKF